MNVLSMKYPAILVVFLLGLLCEARAADLFVNNVTGNDASDGLSKSNSVKTIARAVALAGAGDTVNLERTGRDYAEEVVFADKGGEPGRPITLDGHGATLDGSKPCPSTGWKKVDDKLWCLEGTLSRNALGVQDRIVLERKMAPELTPGQFCVEATQFEDNVLFMKLPPGRRVEDAAVQVTWEGGETVQLDSAQWKAGTFLRYKLPRRDRPQKVSLDGVDAPLLAARDYLRPGEWCMLGKDLYYYPPEGKEPTDMNLRLLVRSSGVCLKGELGHVVIKNLNVKFVWNDAFNVHGDVVDAVFANCTARDCFDEGFSAHDQCETVLDGATFERCDNGVFNVNVAGWSVTRNLVVRECREYGFGVAVLDSQSKHWLTNAVLEENPTPLFGRNLEVDNVKIASRSPASITLAGPIRVQGVTAQGSEITWTIAPGNGSLQLSNCLFISERPQQIIFEKPAEVILRAVFWSPSGSVHLKPKAAPLPLEDWLRQLGERASGSGPLSGTSSSALPKDIGFQEY